jgi:hypothetical protein
VLNSLLRDLPDEWTLRNEGGDSFTPFDVVGHLIHAERTDWIPRARIVLQFGEARPFEAFDRRGGLRENQGVPLGELLDSFAALRSANLQELRGWNLTAADLDRRGRHPALGAVTLAHLLATWASHDLTHLHQIVRSMAYQYREAVGPWRQYLGVMHCEGHGA